jgi:gliding motility-associated-like protein
MLKRLLPTIILVLATYNGYTQSYITPATTNSCYSDNNGTLSLQNNIKPVRRWEMSVTGDQPWVSIVNQTQTMTYTDLNSTAWFRAVVQAEGEPEQYSLVAVVNVWPQAHAGSITGASKVCNGSNAGQLTLSGNTGTVNKWQYSTDNNNWNDISGSGTSLTCNYSNINRKTWYQALVVSGTGCNPATNAFVIDVDNPTNSGSLTGASTVCQGSNSGNIQLTGNNGSVIRWESSSTGSSPWSAIEETSNNLGYSNLVASTWYRAVAQNGVCPSAASSPLEIAVNNPSIGGATIGTSSVCSSVNSGDISLSGQQGIVTKWQYSRNAGISWIDTAITQPVINYADLTQSRIYQAEVKNGVCPASLSTQTKITVYPLPVVSFTAPSLPQGNPVSFTNNSTISLGSLKQFFWDFYDGSSSTSRNPVHTFENPGTYSIKLEVTSDKGCTDSIRTNVDIHEVPRVDFAFSNVCLKSEASFLNTSATSYPSPTYQWNFGDGSPLSGDINPIHKYAAPGSYQVTLTVSTPYTSATKTQAIEIYYQATPAFEAGNVCLGSNTLFINKSKIHDGYLTYNWAFGDSKTSTDLNPVHSYNRPDIYTVRLITFSNYSCSDTIYKDIRVYPVPFAKFSATDVPFGNPVQFNDSSIISQGKLSHSWDFGDGNTSSDQNPQHTYSLAGNYLVTLVVQSDSGCSNSYAKTVWIYPKPHASFMAQPVCVYDSVTFENQSTISSGSLTYYWQFGDGNSSTLKNPIIKYNKPGVYPVVLIATSDKKGGDTIAKTIEIYPEPVVNFTAMDVCDGYSMDFQNQSTVGSGSIATYFWDFGDGTNAARQSPSKLYLNPGSYKVSLSVITDKNCKGSVTKSATIHNNPIANFTVASVCLKQEIFPVNLSQVTDNASFEWNMGDGSMYGVFAPSHVYSNPGVFAIKMKVTDLNGCIDSLSRNVTIYTLPPTNAGRDTTVIMGFSTQLDASGGVAFQWYPSDGLSSVFVKNPIATPLATTTYYLTSQDQFGCVNRDSVTIQVEDQHIIMASNVVTPDGNGKNDTWIIKNIETYPDAEVTIFNRWGSIVFHTNNYQNDWNGNNGKHDILPDGAYFYVIKMPGSDKVYKGTVTILRNK